MAIGIYEIAALSNINLTIKIICLSIHGAWLRYWNNITKIEIQLMKIGW
jgi:hypothetical protein